MSTPIHLVPTGSQKRRARRRSMLRGHGDHYSVKAELIFSSEVGYYVDLFEIVIAAADAENPWRLNRNENLIAGGNVVFYAVDVDIPEHLARYRLRPFLSELTHDQLPAFSRYVERLVHRVNETINETGVKVRAEICITATITPE
jgi:hypothetical protein